MIEVLIGMIGSSKSTYARKRAREGAIIVCHDSLTESLHAEYRYEQGLRDFYRGIERDIAERAIRGLRDVVVDRTHLTRESRQRWVDLGKRLSVPVQAVQFARLDAAIHARRRFEADPRGRTFEEWLQVSQHHEQQALAEPLRWREEGFARIVLALPLQPWSA